MSGLCKQTHQFSAIAWEISPGGTNSARSLTANQKLTPNSGQTCLRKVATQFAKICLSSLTHLRGLLDYRGKARTSKNTIR